MTHNSVQLIKWWPSNSRSNWNLEMLVFEEGGNPENPEKNPRSKEENQQQTQSTYDAGSGNRTQATLVLLPECHIMSGFMKTLLKNLNPITYIP